MDAQSVLVAARIARLLDVVGSDAADRLAVLPLGLPLSPGTVPGTAAWEQAGRSKVAEAAFALLCNETGTRSMTWSPPNGRRVWDVYREVLSDALVGRRGLTDVQQDQLDQAESLLFDEVDGELEPTAEYEEYSEHADRVEDLSVAAARARLEGDEKQATTLDARLRAAQSDWVLTGHKDTIGPAIATLERLRAEDPVATWVRAQHALDAVDVQQASMYGEFYPTPLTPLHLDEVDWQRVEVDAADVEPLLAEAEQRFPEVRSADIDPSALAGLERLSFRVTVAALHRDWLNTDEILTADIWAWPDDRTPVAAASGPELMGAFADGVVLVKDVVAEIAPARQAVVDLGPDDQPVAAFGPLVLSSATATGGAGRLHGIRVLDSDAALTMLTRTEGRLNAESGQGGSAPEVGTIRSSLLSRYAKLVPSAGVVAARRLPTGTVANVRDFRDRADARLGSAELRRSPESGGVARPHRPERPARPAKPTRPERPRRPETGKPPRSRRGYVWVDAEGGVPGHWERKRAPSRYSGRVVASGDPVLGAEVVLLDADHEQAAATHTGSGGRFRTKAPPGSYLLQVSAEGYLPVSAHLPEGSQTDLEIALEEAPESWQIVAFTRFDLQPPVPHPEASLDWG